jgi:hypothetical protein
MSEDLTFDWREVQRARFTDAELQQKIQEPGFLDAMEALLAQPGPMWSLYDIYGFATLLRAMATDERLAKRVWHDWDYFAPAAVAYREADRIR